MSLKEMFVALRQKEVPPGDWSATGPQGKKLKVIAHEREVGPNAKNGTISFTFQGEDEHEHTIVGVVETDGTESITLDGTLLLEPDIDGGITAKPVLKGLQLRLRGSVIVKLQFDSDDGSDVDPDEYRFEGKVGEIKL